MMENSQSIHNSLDNLATVRARAVKISTDDIRMFTLAQTLLFSR